MPRHFLIFRYTALLFCAAGLALAADSFPVIEADSLAGAKVTLPAAAKGHPTVVIIGFTHESQNQTDAWARKVAGQYDYYSMAVIEDAPRLVRGMITSGMKKGVPKDQLGRVMTVTHGQKELKAAVGFDRGADAYVLLLDGEGAIRWRSHGAPADAALAELKSQAAGLK